MNPGLAREVCCFISLSLTSDPQMRGGALSSRHAAQR
jgi:hypothetical protein